MTPEFEPIKVLGSILKSEMELADGQIMLGLENWAIPKTKGLYIALFYGPDVSVGQVNDFDPATNQEIQSVAMLHQIEIDAMSFNDEARLRKEEIIMAINSVFGQQTLEANLMKINELPSSFVPAPTLEETKQLNRFRLTFSMNALHQKIKAVNYYDQFGAAKVTTDA